MARVRRYQMAGLLARKMAPSEVSGLTPAQACDVACYPRDNKGELRVPRSFSAEATPLEASLERDVGLLRARKGMCNPQKYAEVLERLLDLWEVPQQERGKYRG